MSEVVERLARIEERGINRDARLDRIETKLDTLVTAHTENVGSMKAHKFWVGGIAAAVSGGVAILAKVLPFTNGFPR